MSEKALCDNSSTLETERKEGSLGKACCNVASVDNADEIVEVQEKKINCASSALPSVNGDHSGDSPAEMTNAEVEYIDSENLKDLEDVDSCLKVVIFFNCFEVSKVVYFFTLLEICNVND